jgi:predicted MFS family arabinose efflux permease
MAGMFVLVAFLVIGGAWFVLSPELGRVRIPRSRGRMGAVLFRPAVLISSSISLIFVASFGAIEVGVVAAFGKTSIEPGIVLGIFSVGSILGGFLLGHRPVTQWSLTIRLAIVTLGTALTLFNQGALWLSIALFIAGFGVAPALAVLYTMISATVRFSESAESFGWLSTGMLIGAALGAALAGFTVDAYGPVGGMLVSLIFLVLSCVLAAMTVRHMPDMRHGNVSSMPETEPIAVSIR